MVVRRLVTACIVLGCSVIATGQSSPWEIRIGAPGELTEAGASLQSDYFRVTGWGLLRTRTTLWHDEWLYPTSNDRNPAGVFEIEAHKFGVGDFDGDGRHDILVNWGVFPHVIPRPPITPSVLLNKRDGVVLSDSIWQGAAPARMLTYKVAVQDFNGDGKDDAVAGAFGILERTPTGYRNVWERVPLILSTPTGVVDASDRIRGQETAPLPTFTFAHDMSSGDVNRDGSPDFYQGRHLFINDGTGGFTPSNDLLPVEARPGAHYVMSSAIGDLDNDGTGDLVIALADGQPSDPKSGWIFLSRGSGSLLKAQRQLLPAGLYGLLNTKHNSIALADVDSDGRLDILIGQTQATPYYQGRRIQLLMNRGEGTFVDETSSRMSAADRPAAQGEGVVQVIDVNGDGHLDVIDSAGEPVQGAEPGSVGLAILVNDGTGVFSRVPNDALPFVQNFHVRGREQWRGFPFGYAQVARVIGIPGDAGMPARLLVQMRWTPDHWPLVPGDATETVMYLLEPRAAFRPVPGPRRLADAACISSWAARVRPDVARYLVTSNRRIRLVGAPGLPAIVEVGSVDEYLPAARLDACGQDVRPSKPTGLRVIVNGATLTVTWNPAVYGKSYKAEFRREIAGPLLASFESSSTSMTIPVSPGITGSFVVQVVAANAAGVSPPADPVTFTLGQRICSSVPDTPTGVTGAVIDGVARMSWNVSPAASAYVLRAGTTSSTANLFDSNIGARTAISAPVGAGFGAYIRVFAVNPCGESAASAVLFIGS